MKKYQYLSISVVFAIFSFWLPVAQAFTFAVMGDTQSFGTSQKGGLQQTARQIAKQKVSLVMSMGDLVHSCDGSKKCENKYKQWKSILGSLMNKTYAVVGNHDRTAGSRSEKVWRKVFKFPTNGPSGFEEQTYSFDYDNSHFVVLDTERPSSSHVIDDTQRQWLEDDLSKNTKENTFVFFHEPAFHTNFEKTDNLEAHPGERDALWSILDKHNVTAVFNGHEHLFSEKIIDSSVFPGATHSIHQFAVARTDVSAPDPSDPGNADYYYYGEHYVTVNVIGKQITLKVYTTGGSLVKNFTFSSQ